MPYAIAAAALLVLAALFFFVSRPDVVPPSVSGPASSPAVEQSTQALDGAAGGAAATSAPPVSAADREFDEKQALYARLEKARRDLDQRLARMKMKLWNVRLPRAEAEQMNEQLMSAYQLLNRPKLLGAFHDLGEIERELTRVEYAKGKVAELLAQVEAIKAAQPPQDER